MEESERNKCNQQSARLSGLFNVSFVKAHAVAPVLGKVVRKKNVYRGDERDEI